MAKEVQRHSRPKNPEEAQQLRIAQAELDTYVDGLSRVTGYIPGLSTSPHLRVGSTVVLMTHLLSVVYIRRLSQLLAPARDVSCIQVEEAPKDPCRTDGCSNSDESLW